jgi:hypothetical protein
MKITNEALVEFLIRFIEGDSDSERMMEDAYKGTKKIWEKNEWIFVKDIEMCLKGIKKTLSTSGFSRLSEVGQFILSNNDLNSVQNVWVRERIKECRSSLAELGGNLNSCAQEN